MVVGNNDSIENLHVSVKTVHPTSLKLDELAQARKEIEVLKAADPFNVLELVIELQIERMRTTEAMDARDALVHRLIDAYESLRQKTEMLEVLRKGTNSGSLDILGIFSAAESPEISRMKEEMATLQNTIKNLRNEVKSLKDGTLKTSDPPPCYETAKVNIDHLKARPQSQPVRMEYHRNASDSSNLPQASSQGPFSQLPTEYNTPKSPITEPFNYRLDRNRTASDEPADLVKARNAILAFLPLPEGVPEDTLNPLSIPASFTLQEFLANISGPIRTSLSHYRLFYAPTTLWCPEREEHGYFYAPAFKCSTNPRVSTAHRWSPVDVTARMNKPTECFFNKEGTWYYAGMYKAFRLDDLSLREWAELPIETTQAIVKETIAARKNTSPQNVYEVTQLYAAGALKVTCVGLQCVGFNNGMYRVLLEQAAAFSQSKVEGAGSPPVVALSGGVNPGVAVVSTATGSGPSPSWSSGSAGVGDIVSGLRTMSLGR